MSETPEDAASGEREMFGPYELHERLGRGAMGEVHRAYDTKRDRFVALKRLSPELADDEGIRERFRRESQVAARLASPHVIPIHDFGMIDGRLYLDMRLVDGSDLQKLLATQGRLAPERAVALVTQLAGALDAAHADGLVHRDVKPSNALVTTHRDQDFVYLVDFGIVRLADSTAAQITRTGTSLGTVAYMAPEAIEGHTVDARADVYALAIVLYEALTGAAPYVGEIPAVLYQHVNAAVPVPSRARPELPAGFDDVLATGLAKDPTRRFPSAGALADAAREALTTAPAAGAPSGAASPTVPAAAGSAVTVPGGGGTPSGGPAPFPSAGPGDPTISPVPPPPARSGADAVFRRAPDGPGGPSTPGGPNPPGGPGGLPGPYGTPAAGPPPPARRSRTGLIIGVAAGVLVLVVVAVVAIVALRPGAPMAPRVVTTSAASVPLTTAVPVSGAPGCDRYTPNNGIWITADKVAAEEVRSCTDGPATVVYARWPSTADSDAYYRQWAALPSTNGAPTWSNPANGPTQGPYHQAVAGNGACTTILSWTGQRLMGEVYARTCPEADNALTVDRFPRVEDLKTLTATVPGATASGCGPSTPAPGASGTTPAETRSCTAGAATVTYLRWGTPAEAGADVRARQNGLDPADTPFAWSTPGGARQGPFARVQPGTASGGCTESLAYDAAPYSIQVAAPDCAAADAAVTTLTPPDGARLPH